MALQNLGCGLLAGVVATTVTHPADAIKTRQQVLAATADATRSAGGSAGAKPPAKAPVVMPRLGMRALLGTARDMVKEEGMAALWKGLPARAAKRATSQALTWAVFEEVQSRLKQMVGGGSSGRR